MRRELCIMSILALVFSATPAFAQASPPAVVIPPGEEEVDPYTISNANAAATPLAGTDILDAFHGREGVGRIVDDLVEHVQADSRTSEIFKASDFVRLRRTLKEQFCYILNGGCDYTGRDMVKVHEDHGITTAEFNALVELLQEAMSREGVSFGAQNRLLAKLAPMERLAVTR